MNKLQSFVNRHRIRMEVEWTDTNPNMAADDKWMASARHFRCILRRGRHQMTVPFSQGQAHEKEPTALDVLDCLASDACGVDNAGTFEDWCAEYGYDTDSRKAEKTYNTCVKQASKLRDLLGDEAYESLLYNTERQ